MTTLAIVIFVWLAGNLIHLAWIKTRLHIWESGVVRAQTGLLEHAGPFSCGGGEKTALLFIHGFADLPYGWTRIARRLTDNSPQMTCHAMRVPRWGEPLSSQCGVTLDEIRSVIDGKIGELSASHSNVWLVGHSMGCAFAIDALPRNAGKIRGLVTLAPLIRVSNRRVPFLTARFWYNLGTRVLWLARTFESPFTTRLCAADDPGFNYAVDKFIPYSVYDILFAVTKNNRHIPIPRDMPVFCALSRNDKVIDNASAQRWFDALSGPKSLYIANNSAHALHMGEEWEEITDRIGAFVLGNSD